ncbi:MAG: TetR/AcrR family transcriptional regulator [Pseudomonas sp.]|uniref:TetR/AcrR family transcriptional regulator n=1 Tax=Pseudomonas sp. TaxID=306 RepID=UPI002722D37A|nr:TetR/AcrR family transcriptional regulator [Pseudomonas sp.]MDO9617261.1 TetR/AcrR family transcriptional regulator [Pseudomonas sp.]MDP2444843.1 TetR/AcrR family transcriptional regulator [Pseudomonas sp.]MDZ4333231.1 TetR/AcrR family transcriptional regulator [Pseudomonas sp.]
MRYSEDHKAQTHQRIIEEAARLFRRDGVGATGLQPLMKTLGLTHGGFYAHFKSKDELVETALRHSADTLTATTSEMANSDQPLARLISGYLSSAHRANPGDGCPLPTMSAELGQRGAPSPVTDELIRDRLQTIEAGLNVEHADEQSVLILSAMVGALLLSRSVSDPELSDRLLKTTRRLLIEQNTGDAAQTA